MPKYMRSAILIRLLESDLLACLLAERTRPIRLKDQRAKLQLHTHTCQLNRRIRAEVCSRAHTLERIYYICVE